MTDSRLHSPASERNQTAILAELQRLLAPSGRLLEIASGSGQHAAFFAGQLPGWQWQPSDPDAAALASIAAWASHCGAPNLLAPLQLDVLAPHWARPAAAAAQATALADRFDAVFNANMLHIAPWAACAALMQGAALRLAPGGLLITYGPYRVQGEPWADSNAAFDASLRQRDATWGVRWLHDVAGEAAQAGLALRERVSMPANNQLLVFCAP
jgi:SAM-dependent methyltransferase